ncbi:MAG: phosphotransferase, partial [Thermoanaerobaculia bacterium]|nr:phosphotransferase [Thermoanaerobaculia bacterium]
MRTRGPIDPERLEEYLRSSRDPAANLESLEPLGGTDQDVKAYGYGQPMLVRYTVGDRVREIVVRTAAPDPFGHDRRADRVGALVLDYDTFGTMPRHIEALDVGVLDAEGSLVSLPPGEPFLITDYVEGRLYAVDLREQAGADRPDSRALDRVRALARYLVELHRDPRDPDGYTRDLRDTIGHGEGIFGLADSYPADDRVAPPSRLESLEVAAVRHRWKLASGKDRARRTHGDFHPFNLLFREGTDFTVLDCSRGGAGEPADDVTCLSINYPFFALLEHGTFT